MLLFQSKHITRPLQLLRAKAQTIAMVCKGPAIGWDSDASVSVRLSSALSLLPLLCLTISVCRD